MSTAIRRAGSFVAVGALSLVAPLLVRSGGLGRLPGPGLGGSLGTATLVAAVPFLIVAGVAFTVDRDDAVFEWFARPGDYEEGRLYSLVGFALAAAALTAVTVQFGLSLSVYVATVMLLVVGALAQKGALERTGNQFLAMAAFAVAAFGTAVLAQLVVAAIVDGPFEPPLVVFLAGSGALLAALLRTMLYERDDPLVLFSVALVLWLFADIGEILALTPLQVVVALAITIVLGYLSYALETASITGMITGVFLAFLTIVLGNYGLFAVLIAFFGIGGLSTKFRYGEKQERGIAEENEGARGSGNVLANSAVALAALLGYAAGARVGLPQELFLFAFTGSIAAAMSDTLSSEFGGLFDNPRLITTLRPVPPGTDGGVTWQGEVAGVVGAGLVAAIAFVSFSLSPLGAAIIVLAGVAGMTVDSLLGATLEGRGLGNMGVNFVATLAAAAIGVTLSLVTGLVPL